MTSPVIIVDYGMGNVGSLRNMLSKVNVPAQLSNEPEVIRKADRLILPGVGAFDEAMRTLEATSIKEAIIDRATTTDRLLVGVCLGMQLLMEGSEEGQLPGLGLIAGRCLRLPATVGSEQLRVPHMGWNQVEPVRPSRRVPTLGVDARYYFVHSYFVRPDDSTHSLGRTHYGLDFTSAVESDSVLGFQFHPEKSHRHGMRLLSDIFSDDRTS
jgi:glutamine amidotransferase